MQRKTQRGRGGFTLVEMLVVIVIITILAAILVPAIFYAQRKARNTRIAVEIGAMKQALEAYKLKYSEYPPNFNDDARVKAHLRFCFPRRSNTDYTPTNLDPAEALVFWLRGYYNDPLYPVGADVTAAQKTDGRTAFFEFDRTRLLEHGGTAGWPEYEAPYCQKVPYAYFSSTSAGGYTPLTYTGPSSAGTVKAYTADGGGYAEATSFQIVSAGQDGQFSSTPTTPTATNPNPTYGPYPTGPYSVGERDNLATFTEGNTLDDQAAKQ